MTDPSTPAANRQFRLVRADDQLDLRVELVDPPRHRLPDPRVP